MNTHSAPWSLGGAILTSALMVATAFAQPPLPPEEDPVPVQEQQVLTQGPIHEAFAEPISYDIQNRQTLTIPDQPPENIDEIPPDVKPAADSQWIPGYWAWDVEGQRFIWISGIWRVAPVGHRWVPGYWTQIDGGFTWVSGVWVPEDEQELAYLPYPPDSLDEGPNVPAPSSSFTWVPGCWIWHHGQWAWRPGYWVENYPQWVWVPAHHVWTPYGCVFVAGYWDFLPEVRAILFAPVYFPPTVVHHVVYQPQVCLHIDVIVQHLFVQPGHCHYYFGDYYDNHYAQNHGIVPWMHFHQRRGGFDPLFAHKKWEHRNDRNWVNNLEDTFIQRRQRMDLRPPRTLAQQKTMIGRLDRGDRTRIQTLDLAVNVNTLLDRSRGNDRDRDNSPRMKLVKMDAGERQRVTLETKQIKDLRQARVQIDKETVKLPDFGRGRNTTGGKPRIDLGKPGENTRTPDANVRVPKLKLPEIKRETTGRRPRIDLDKGGDVKIDTDKPDFKLPGRPEPRVGKGNVGNVGKNTGIVPPGLEGRLKPRGNPLPGGDEGKSGRLPKVDLPKTDLPKSDPPRTGRSPRQFNPGANTPKIDPPKIDRGGKKFEPMPEVKSNIPNDNGPRFKPQDPPKVDLPKFDRTPRQPKIDFTPRGNAGGSRFKPQDPPKVDLPKIDRAPRQQPRIDFTPKGNDSAPRIRSGGAPKVDVAPKVDPSKGGDRGSRGNRDREKDKKD